MTSPAPPLTEDLSRLRPDLEDPVLRTGQWAQDALDVGLLDLPLPGRGATAERYAALEAFGRVDLDLARLVEAHVDALAILAELHLDGAHLDPDTADADRQLWGVWAANPPTAPLAARRSGGGWLLDGTKPWCSGAGTCDRALVTAQTDDGYRLFAVGLAADSAVPVDGSWPAEGMRGSDSRSVRFTAHPADPVGDPQSYIERPGFWHGAVGVAAVWLGGAVGVAGALSRAHARRTLNAHALAHAGAVDADLASAQAMLAHAAAAFDSDPKDDSGRARLLAGRARAVVERCATDVSTRVGRALGAAPLALDAEHAKRVSDLALYLRQSHAERDLEELGTISLDTGSWPW